MQKIGAGFVPRRNPSCAFKDGEFSISTLCLRQHFAMSHAQYAVPTSIVRSTSFDATYNDRSQVNLTRAAKQQVVQYALQR